MLDLGGTYRECFPQETLQRIQPYLLNPFGITRVADITGLDDIGIHTSVAYRPNASTLSCSQGKGLTKELAQASALMESIELWHAEECPPADLTGSYYQLQAHYPLVPIHRDDFSISPDNLMNVSLEWLKATELNRDQCYYIPRAMIYMDHHQDTFGKMLFFANTNGLASGNSLEEAICHAIYEIIERNAMATNPRPYAQSFNLEAIHHPLCRALIQNITQKDYHLHVFDISTTINLPVYQAVLDDRHLLRSIGVFGGMGCHLSPQVAFIRAVTEAIQSRLTYISGARDDIEEDFQMLRQSTFQFQTSAKVGFPEREPALPNHFSDCLKLLQNALISAGYPEIFVYNHTRPEIDIPVVHVYIPSMRFDAASMIAPLRRLL